MFRRRYERRSDLFFPAKLNVFQYLHIRTRRAPFHVSVLLHRPAEKQAIVQVDYLFVAVGWTSSGSLKDEGAGAKRTAP
jgi:hypothetical protein